MIISEETGTEIGRFSQFYVLLEGCNRLPHVCNQLHCMKEMRFLSSKMSQTGYSINVTNYTEMLMHVNHNIYALFLTWKTRNKHSLTYVIHGVKLAKH